MGTRIITNKRARLNIGGEDMVKLETIPRLSLTKSSNVPILWVGGKYYSVNFKYDKLLEGPESLGGTQGGRRKNQEEEEMIARFE